MNFPRSCIAPAISGVLLFLCFYTEPGMILAHVALAPVLVAILRGSGMFPLWLFGAVFGALYFFWLKVFSVLAPIVMTVVHGLWVSAGFLPCLLIRRGRSAWQVLAAGSVFWVVSEGIRSIGPYGYEWGSLGYTQYGSLKMAAYASIGGVWLISMLIFISNALLAGFWLRKDQRWLGVAAVYWALLWGFSPADRLSGDYSAAKDFVLVQTNVSPYLNSLDRERVSREQLGRLAGESQSMRPANFILPETLFSAEITGIREFLIEEPRSLLAGFISNHPDRRLLVGAIDKDDRGFYNAAILFDSDGHRMASSRKRHLVPFGESIPGLANNRWARSFGEKLGTPFFSAGDTFAPLLFGDRRAAVLICYEGTFTWLVDQAASSADLVINISNDAWTESRFGHEQHMRFLRFRAIETGKPVIRVGNSGPTVLFAPNGRLVAGLPDPSPAVLDLSANFD